MSIRTFAVSMLFFLGCGLFAQSSAPKALEHYDKGLALQSDEKWYEAGEEFLEAVNYNPAFGDAWFHLARCAYEINDFNLCMTYLDTAEKYAKDRTDILNLRGMCLISLGRLDEAKEIFEGIISDYPNNIEARFGLAELELYNGGFDSAQSLYTEALKRQGTNRKALLSLAVLAAETGKDSLSENYINQALRYHSGVPEVHYLAAYLSAKRGDLKTAERRARAALQIKPDFDLAYTMLSSVLYAQEKYDETIDICDYLINKDRNVAEAWYLKGWSLYRQNKGEQAIDTWSSALGIEPLDEVLRSALEIVADEILPLEDSRREQWAQWHIQKAREHSKLFMGEEARYEYQRALRLDPDNFAARSEFAELLNKMGLTELYLNQLTFIKDNSSVDESSLSDDERYKHVRTNDIIESYSALMKYSLSAKWNVDPFYLDKTRWNIGIYYTKSPVQLLHCDAEEVAAEMAEESFKGVASTAVHVEKSPVSSYRQAFSMARKSGDDYFVLMEYDESEREVSIEAAVYNGRNGTQIEKISLFRTGNDRFSSVLRSFRRSILNMLPARGKIIARSGNSILVDMGKTEGISDGAVLDVVKAGYVRTADSGTGVVFDDKYSLGQILISQTGEQIAEGALTQRSFYDRVNVGDEVLLRSVPADSAAQAVADTSPAADENGDAISADRTERLTAEDLGLVRTPLFIDLIRKIY